MTANDPTPESQPTLDFDSATAEAESFEVLFAQLETIAGQLEAGSLSLEQSISLYERGMELAARCQQLLGDVEQRIEVLREGANGGSDQQ
jgi:exodeoxyribonuclease VII small subunit